MIASPRKLSGTREFKELAAAINPNLSTDRIADLLANFRSAVRAEAVSDVTAFLNEIGTPITRDRTEHERGIMYAARRVGEQFGGAR